MGQVAEEGGEKRRDLQSEAKDSKGPRFDKREPGRYTGGAS